MLHAKAYSLASDVLRRYDDQSKDGRERRKEFEQWFMALEQDLVMLDSRLKKQRWLEDETNRLKSTKKTKNTPDDAGNNGNLSGNQDHLELADTQKRLKSLIYKVNKSEKEIDERISSRKVQEFPTSRSEGEL